MASTLNISAQSGLIYGPGYFANILNNTIYGCGYVQDGQQVDAYRNYPDRGIQTVFTTERNTAGELLELFTAVGVIIPKKSDWPVVTDPETGNFLYRGVNLGGLIIESERFAFPTARSGQDIANDFYAMKAYEWSNVMINADTGEVDPIMILQQVAYFNLWGFLPGLHVGDPSKDYLETNGLTFLINANDRYPEAGSDGPLSYFHFKTAMHYFFPTKEILEPQLAWIRPLTNMEGNVSIFAQQEDIDEFLDGTGATAGVTREGVAVDLSSVKLSTADFI